MNIEQFKQAKRAANAFIEENGDEHAPYNTILTMCYMEILLSQVAMTTGRTATVATPTATTTPEWLVSTLPKFAGRKVTSGEILKAAGQPAGMKQLRQVGAWLREILGEPSKSNGQTLFSVPAAYAPSGEQKQPSPEGEHKPRTISPEAWLVNALEYSGATLAGKMTISDITMALKLGPKLHEITHARLAAALEGRGIPLENGRYDFG
jgi:hypothetical protein